MARSIASGCVNVRLWALTRKLRTYKICTMRIKGKVFEFEWDKWNLDKSYLKHGVLPKEAEEVFISDDAFVLPDVKHSQNEDRFIILGKTLDKLNLFIVFTLRGKKARVISARRMHKKEVEKYDKIKKNTKI